MPIHMFGTKISRSRRGVVAHGDSADIRMYSCEISCLDDAVTHYASDFYLHVFEKLPILKNEEARQAFLEIARSGIDLSSPQTIEQSLSGSRFHQLAEKSMLWVGFANGLYQFADNWHQLIDALRGWFN